MSHKIILIGADQPALDAVLSYKRTTPDATATVLYPECNPLAEFSCVTLDSFMGNGIDFPENLRACAIAPEDKTVMVRDNFTGEESHLEYDTLIFATGSAPAPLDVPGSFLSGIRRVGDYNDATRLTAAEGTNVVIGDGLNLLLAIARLLDDAVGTIEVIPSSIPQACKPLGDAMTAMVLHHLTQKGVIIHTGETLKAIEGTNRANRVLTDKRTIEAARIINATSNIPVTCMVKDAGLDLDTTGHILVDDNLKAADSIYACGGCASFISPACAKPIPGASVKSTEPRQSRTLAASLAGTSQPFHAPVCAYSIPMGDMTVAGAGLSMEGAKECGFTPMSAMVVQFDRAHFMPEASLMTLELVFDAQTRRVVGIQGLGQSGDALAGRISAVSALLASHPTVEDIANLEVAYSPPFASAMDILNTAGNVAENILSGSNEGIDPLEFDTLWQNRESNEYFFLDCREFGNAEPFLERHPLHWNTIPQGEIARRVAEVPRDKKVILICNSGARSYEAQVCLKAAGIEDVVNVDGGMVAIKQSGVEI
ncbi:FAD-dependent oxidoreductase [Pseudodesulfovibrio piezophilus]|uniref:Pyridine nucleotide-disulphide oxidoreductase dimerisation region n=1 Tax=Pseudodesulfovibrio piezophilus (strain DSM 21447 / JCM 15486 / C1TLV30) TaxID=1322246 RepID=M1WSB0_PSEP2|nr:FAD-dependent oxidoreductase [Pseudodesulfovibrio piezophilus]CCH48797.1 Pyridine nucleotide-disulphide oxidoreductase dimerisation region [Pseudodesulfovibrio piezophilus C1TLV30]